MPPTDVSSGVAGSPDPVVTRCGPPTTWTWLRLGQGYVGAHGSCSRRCRSRVHRLSRAAPSLLAAPRPAEDDGMVRRVQRLVLASPVPRYVTPHRRARSEDGSQQVAVERLQPMVQRVDRGGSRQIVRSRLPVGRHADEATGALDHDGSGAGGHPDLDGST
jgi:hypothetical protein